MNLHKLKNVAEKMFVINPLRNAACAVPWCQPLLFPILTPLSLHDSLLPCNLEVPHESG